MDKKSRLIARMKKESPTELVYFAVYKDIFRNPMNQVSDSVEAKIATMLPGVLTRILNKLEEMDLITKDVNGIAYMTQRQFKDYEETAGQ